MRTGSVVSWGLHWGLFPALGVEAAQHRLPIASIKKVKRMGSGVCLRPAEAWVTQEAAMQSSSSREIGCDAALMRLQVQVALVYSE